MSEDHNIEVPDLYKTLVSDAPECIFLLDAQGMGEYFNPRWTELTGHSIEDLVGDGWLTFIHPDDRYLLLQSGQFSVQTCAPRLSAEYRLVSDKGEWLSVTTSFQPLKDDIGNVSGYVGITVKSTCHTRPDTVVELDNLLSCLLVDTAQEVCFTLLRDNVISSWNMFAEDLFGWHSEDVIGKNFIDVIVEEKNRQLCLECLSKRAVSEISARHRDGSEILVRLNIHHFDLCGEKLCCALIADLSRIHQPGSMITDDSHQINMLREQLESFSYSVSHDLRAPLRGIDGFSQALLEDYSDNLDKTGQDYLRRVRKAAQYMGTLIDDLLILSRISSHELTIEEINLGDLAVKIIDQLQQEEPQRRVEIDIDKDMVTRGDMHLIEIVLRQLLDNAWKFSAGRACARIQFRQSQQNGQTVYCISDNGAGFNMDYSDKLFKIFQRLHSPRDFPGNGAGLAVANEIVARHNGRLWATGEPDNGAEFSFTLGLS